jgi:hypothetical protein
MFGQILKCFTPRSAKCALILGQREYLTKKMIIYCSKQKQKGISNFIFSGRSFKSHFRRVFFAVQFPFGTQQALKSSNTRPDKPTHFRPCRFGFSPALPERGRKPRPDTPTPLPRNPRRAVAADGRRLVHLSGRRARTGALRRLPRRPRGRPRRDRVHLPQVPHGAAPPAAADAQVQLVLVVVASPQIPCESFSPSSYAAPEGRAAGSGGGPHEDPAALRALPGCPQRAPRPRPLPLPAVQRRPRRGPRQAPELPCLAQQRPIIWPRSSLGAGVSSTVPPRSAAWCGAAAATGGWCDDSYGAACC